MTRFRVICALLLNLVSVAIPLSGQVPADSIEKLVGDLRSQDSRVRDSRRRQLKIIGERAVPHLIYALGDTSQTYRGVVLDVLAEMGPVAAGAVTMVKSLLKKQPYYIRVKAANTLGNIGGGGAVRELIEALDDPQLLVQQAAAIALHRIGPEAELAVPKLLSLLSSSDDDLRYRAAGALGAIGSAAAPAVPTLTHLLDDPVSNVRASSAVAIGRIGQVDTSSFRGLERLLAEFDEGVRAAAISSLGNLARKYPTAVELLGRALSDSSAANREDAARALQRVGPRARPALRGLVTALRDEGFIREVVVATLDSIGPPASAALPVLTRMAGDVLLHDAVSHAIARIGTGKQSLLATIRSDTLDSQRLQMLVTLGPQIVNQFVDGLRDPNPTARLNSARALSYLRSPSEEIRHALFAALADSNEAVGFATAEALSNLDNSTAAALDSALSDTRPMVRGRAAIALAKFDPPSNVINHLRRLLGDSVQFVAGAAAYALASTGQGSSELLSALVYDLGSKYTPMRQRAALAIRTIAVELGDAQNIDHLPQLRTARDALAASDDSKVRENAQEVRRAVELMSNLWWKNLRQSIANWAIAHWEFTGPAALLLLLLVSWTALFFVRPLWLLRINESIESGLQVPAWGLVNVPLRYAILVGFFHYRNRVLDAWVDAVLPDAKRGFAKRQTVRERAIHVPTPIQIDGRVVPIPDVENIRSVFASGRNTIVICGEGGTGKTSLACQIAWWAMESDSSGRIIPQHSIVPVLIEHDFPTNVPRGTSPILYAVRGQLNASIPEEQPSEGLVKRLLATKRLLVVVDHLSELSSETRRLFRVDDPDLRIGALVVTSRVEEELHGVPHTVISPLRIRGNRLSAFMEAYLTQRRKRDLFDDAEYFEACRRLSEMVGDRDTTVLMAKLYAEQMIANKEGARGLRLPESIPSLILSYLNDVNRNALAGDPDDRTVHRVAKAVGWACVRETFRPMTARRVDVIQFLNWDGTDQVLRYLEERLKLVQTIGPAREEMRFALDPVAEYLAAMTLVERCGSDDARWAEALNQIDGAEGAPEAIKGFLQALRDCLIDGRNDIPERVWAIEAVSQRLGLDPQVLTRARLSQRTRRLTFNLHLPDAEDRLAAVEMLGRIGAAAAVAIPDLEDLAVNDVLEVRNAAAAALLRIRQPQQS